MFSHLWEEIGVRAEVARLKQYIDAGTISPLEAVDVIEKKIRECLFEHIKDAMTVYSQENGDAWDMQRELALAMLAGEPQFKPYVGIPQSEMPWLKDSGVEA